MASGRGGGEGGLPGTLGGLFFKNKLSPSVCHLLDRRSSSRRIPICTRRTACEVFYESVLLCLGQGQIAKLDCQFETLVDGKGGFRTVRKFCGNLLLVWQFGVIHLLQ